MQAKHCTELTIINEPPGELSDLHQPRAVPCWHLVIQGPKDKRFSFSGDIWKVVCVFDIFYRRVDSIIIDRQSHLKAFFTPRDNERTCVSSSVEVRRRC